MNRRTFLATAPAFLGLREILAADETPGWYRAALDRMRRTGRSGVVLVAPNDPKMRRRWGSALWALAADNNPGAHELLCEAVFICVRRDRAGEGNCFLLDPDGKRVETTNVPIETMEDPGRFTATFRRLIRGRHDARLPRLAAEIKERLSREVAVAVNRLDADSPAERDDAFGTVRKNADAMIPYLAHLGATGRSAELRGRARDVILDYYRATKENKTGPRLPYGCELPKFVSSCGTLVPDDGPRMACGLGSVPQKVRKFVRLLAKK